jgi:acetyl-CoA carboxylase beta subunit
MDKEDKIYLSSIVGPTPAGVSASSAQLTSICNATPKTYTAKLTVGCNNIP